MTLDIGDPSDGGVQCLSSRENLAFRYFLACMYVEAKITGTNQLSKCLRFFLNYLKVDITSSAQMQI